MDHREARWPFTGPESSRRMARTGLCEPALEADSCPHGPCCAGALHVMRSGQPRIVPSPGRRRELDPEVSLVDQPELVPTVAASYVSGHRSGGAGGARPAPTRRNSEELQRSSEELLVETAPGWTTWKRCRSNPSHPEVTRFLLQRSHADTTISVRFQCSRRSTPPDSSDGHLPDSASEETDAHLATLPGPEPRETSLEGSAGLRRGQVQPLLPKR